MNIIKKILLTLLFISIFNLAFSKTNTRREVSRYLQDISVTIKSESNYDASEGSGVLVNRMIGKQKTTFVWTCAHVIDNLRTVRTVIEHGIPKKIVEFNDVQIIKELVESGRRVGEIKMDAKVIKYSDARNGEDLALLMVRAKDYGKDSTKFYLNKDNSIIPIGTQLFHVGSLLGQMGSNSMTTGIVSQVGRIHGKVEFDQTTVTAFPGSSGGGVFLENGEYVGMIARGAGEGFNLMIPIRRIIRWAKEHEIMWAIDPSIKMPTLKEIESLPIENTSIGEIENKNNKSSLNNDNDFPFLIKEKLK